MNCKQTVWFFFQFPSLFSIVQLLNMKSCQFLSAESWSFGKCFCWYLYFIFPTSLRAITPVYKMYFHQYLVAYNRCKNIKASKLVVLTSGSFSSFSFFFCVKHCICISSVLLRVVGQLNRDLKDKY